MEFRDLVMQRYATKRFDGRAVPEEIVQAILDLARFAPSALNLQPWRIRVVTDPAQKEQLLGASWNQRQITSCSHLLVCCANRDLDAVVARLERALVEAAAPEPMRQAVVGMAQGLAQSLSAEGALAWAQGQVQLLVANLLLAAQAHGVASCPMSGFDAAAYSRILELPASLVPTMLVPLGYPADTPAPKLRYALDELLV